MGPAFRVFADWGLRAVAALTTLRAMVRMQSVYRIADRFAEARRKKTPSLPQSEIARLASELGARTLSSSRVSRLEKGYADATREEVEALARVLGVGPEWLINGHASPPVAPVVPPPAPAAPVPPPLPEFRVPQRGGLDAFRYRTLLAGEFEKNRDLLLTRIPPAEWRARKAYGEALREALNALNVAG